MKTATWNTPRPPAVAQDSRSLAVWYWAALGLVTTLFSLSVFGQWVLSPEYFRPVDISPEAMAFDQVGRIRVLEVISTAVAVLALWFGLIRPWRRSGQAPIQGLMMLGALVGYVCDTTINIHDYVMAWNVHSINLSNWGAFFPGHAGPTHYAEALFWGPPMYLYFGVLLGAIQCFVFDRLRPYLGLAVAAVACFGAAFLFDFVAESSIIYFTQAYAWPKVVGALSVWVGEQHQFPLYESFLVAVYSTLYMLHQRSADANGVTCIERGIERVPAAWHLPVRTLAAFGFAIVPIVVYFGGFYLFTLGADTVVAMPAWLQANQWPR